MTAQYRNGTQDSASLDADFPHQIATSCDDWRKALTFCRDKRLKLVPLTHHYIMRGGLFGVDIFAFASEADASTFRQRFGGTPFDPTEHNKAWHWMPWPPWLEGGEWIGFVDGEWGRKIGA